MKACMYVACLAFVSAVPLSALGTRAYVELAASGETAGSGEGHLGKMPKLDAATCGTFKDCPKCVKKYGCAWQQKNCTPFFDTKDAIARATADTMCDAVIDAATETKTLASYVPPVVEYHNGCNCAKNGPTIAYATDTTGACACGHSLLEVGAAQKRNSNLIGLLASLGDTEGLAEEKRMESVRAATEGILGDADSNLESMEALSGLERLRMSQAVEADTPAIDFENFDSSNLKSLNGW